MTSVIGRTPVAVAGTSAATGLPCRVIVTRSPCATRTRSSGNRVFASYTPTVVMPVSNQTRLTIRLDQKEPRDKPRIVGPDRREPNSRSSSLGSDRAVRRSGGRVGRGPSGAAAWLACRRNITEQASLGPERNEVVPVARDKSQFVMNGVVEDRCIGCVAREHVTQESHVMSDV